MRIFQNKLDQHFPLSRKSRTIFLELIDNKRVNRQAHRRRKTIDRDCIGGSVRLFEDYFSTNPRYPKEKFECRYRMSKGLVEKLIEDLGRYDKYWTQQIDCCKQLGLSPHQKITCAIRQLAYGCPADATDEYIRIGESTAVETVKRFVRDITFLYADEWLRPPNSQELKIIMQEYEDRGFPGCRGSIDGMHWGWKNCPQAWAGQYQGSLNDINVLNNSPIFDDYLTGEASEVTFVINGNDYKYGYYLANGIYPSWPVFVKSYRSPRDDASKHHSMLQEAAQKDIEQAFGVLQAKFAIVAKPSRFWFKLDLHNVMKMCIILHNMIVEERSPIDPISTNFTSSQAHLEFQSNHRDPTLFHSFQSHQLNLTSLHDWARHFQLMNDLKIQNWLNRGLSS